VLLNNDHSSTQAVGGVSFETCGNSVVDCAVSFNCLNFQSTTPPKVPHSVVGLFSISVHSIVVPMMGAVGVGV